MRAKKLGRHELLNWANTVTQSDYNKIESLSDGVAFCQIFDAFFPNLFNLNQLKLNSKNQDDWERNFGVVNEILSKLKTFKQIDPSKLTKNKFTQNFEFLQYVFDYIAKNCGDRKPKYNALEKRLDIIKNQNSNVKKFLPAHLIPNDIILKMEKQKYYGMTDGNIASNKDLNYGFNTPINNVNNFQGIDVNIKNYNSNPHPIENTYNPILEKYKEFFEILKEDLKKMMENNVSLSKQIQEVEEERQYYLDKLKNVLKFCEKNENSLKISSETEIILNNIQTIIKHQPEDFK